jgi:ribonucleoside-triphosphate reductase
LDRNKGLHLTITSLVDIMNMIGKCVVSGNVRRTAEIAFGDPFSQEYIDLKNYDKNPHRMDYGWTSNNSVFCETGMDYEDICDRVRLNGEPGFAWLENARAYGRMIEPPVSYHVGWTFPIE